MDKERVKSIIRAFDLGPVRTITQPETGSINSTFLCDDRFVVRMNELPAVESRFSNEEKAYALLRSTSLPLPDIITVDQTDELYDFNFMIMSQLPGQPVTRVWKNLSDQGKKEIGLQAGRYLAEINEVSVSLFGKLDGDQFATWPEFFADYVRRQVTQARKIELLSEEKTEHFLCIYKNHTHLLETVKTSSLTHSDYQWENILTDGKQITGIIDFEWAQGGDAAVDFMIQQRRHAMCPGSATLVRQGYEKTHALTERDETLIALYWLCLQVESIVDFHKRGMRSELQSAVEEFDRLVEKQ